MKDLTKKDIEWLEWHGFKLNDMAACYKRKVGSEELSIYCSAMFNAIVCFCIGYISWHGEGETAEKAFLDFLRKHKALIEELQSFQNELEKI